ncbi:unnamed protein product, partial [Oncorhynchus mykiss]
MATKKSSCTDVTKRSRSPVVLGAEMFSEFQDWCLRTYGDSGKTKTVTRRKYNKIMQTLLQNEESDGMYVDNSHINAKFKFWVKSKGFQVGSNILGEHKKGASGKPVLYVPVKSTVKCVCVCVQWCFHQWILHQWCFQQWICHQWCFHQWTLHQWCFQQWISISGVPSVDITSVVFPSVDITS